MVITKTDQTKPTDGVNKDGGEHDYRSEAIKFNFDLFTNIHHKDGMNTHTHTHTHTHEMMMMMMTMRIDGEGCR